MYYSGLTGILGGKREFRPKLTLIFEDDEAVDATLSPDTRAFLESKVQRVHAKDAGDKANVADTHDESASPNLSNKL